MIKEKEAVAGEQLSRAALDILTELEKLRQIATQLKRSAAVVDEWFDHGLLEALPQVCPVCGGPIVLRNGPFGPFGGCSIYPACKGKLDLTEWQKRARHAIAERAPGAMGSDRTIVPEAVVGVLPGKSERVPFDVFEAEINAVFNDASSMLGAYAGNEDGVDVDFERARIQQLREAILLRMYATRNNRKTVDLPSMKDGRTRSKPLGSGS